MNITRLFALNAALALAVSGICALPQASHSLHEMNVPPDTGGQHPTAIVGARLVDGRGGRPIADSVVVIQGARIVAAGTRKGIHIPQDAEVIDAAGQTLLPGL